MQNMEQVIFFKKNFVLFAMIVVIVTLAACNETINDGVKLPMLYSFDVTPDSAKVGDIITITYTKDNIGGYDYNTEFEITADGQLKYIGHNPSTDINYPTEESRIQTRAYFYIDTDITVTDSEKYPIVRYKSYTQAVSDDGSRRIMTAECYVPENAKSGNLIFNWDMSAGYIYTEPDVYYTPFTVLDVSSD